MVVWPLLTAPRGGSKTIFSIKDELFIVILIQGLFSVLVYEQTSAVPLYAPIYSVFNTFSGLDPYEVELILTL